MFYHFAHVFAVFGAWYGILILSTLRSHSHRACLKTKMQGTQIKKQGLEMCFLTFLNWESFLDQRVMHKMPQIIIAHVKQYEYDNDDELIIGVSKREHFQNNIRILHLRNMQCSKKNKRECKRAFCVHSMHAILSLLLLIHKNQCCSATIYNESNSHGK